MQARFVKFYIYNNICKIEISLFQYNRNDIIFYTQYFKDALLRAYEVMVNQEELAKSVIFVAPMENVWKLAP